MKTNQVMNVDLHHGILQIGHLDHMGDLNQLFNMGNKYRLNAGMPSRGVQEWLKLHTTQEFLKQVERELGTKAVTATRGNKATTRAHLYVLLDAAAYLSPELKLEIYKMFIHGRLLQTRNDSGDEFIELNASVALNAEKVFGKPAHQGHYIQLAKILRDRILPDGHPGWNHATPKQLNERTRIEEAVSDALRMGFIRDWDHLKEVVQKI